jgi:dTDP-4-amino-4,6-dideoxygalactose transaminase
MRSPDLPAILGGAPVRPEGPPAWPFPDPEVRAAVEEALASGAWGQYHGPHVCALEADLAALHGVPHALACASGTLAVEAALRALRVGPGDEVVTAAYDYESNFLTVHALGAKPVLVDLRPDNFQLDESQLAAAFTPLTKAVICSHLHGGIVNVPAVRALCAARGIGVVEDAAQAPGATVFGAPAGTSGDIGTLSFGGSKLLTAGRGGALLFRDAHLYQRAKTWLHRGVQAWAPLSELQAAALRPQLRALAERTAWRAGRVREVAEGIASVVRPTPPGPPSLKGRGETDADASLRSASEELASSPSSAAGRLSPLPFREGGAGGVGCLPFAQPHAGCAPAYYKLGFIYDPGAFGLSRDLFAKAVRAEGVALDAGFRALHVGRSPSRYSAVGALPHAAVAHERCVILHHPVLGLSQADARQVAEAAAKVYRYRDAIARAALA